MTEQTNRKRGKLSTEEEQFILLSKDVLTIEEIAEKINRTTEPVIRFLGEKVITTHAGMNDDQSLERQLKARLHKKPFWKEIVNQFGRVGDNEELKYFEDIWISLMKQFHENVTATEELEIKQWITLEVLMNRSMKERKKNIEQVEKLEQLLNEEYAKGDLRDSAVIMSLDQQLSYARNSISSYTNDHTKILGQIKDIRRDLKMARSDRIKKIEDGKLSFPDLLRQLEEEDIREREGLEAEVVSRAVDKARSKFSQQHLFGNNRYDQPILTPESVLQGEEDEQEEAASEEAV